MKKTGLAGILFGITLVAGFYVSSFFLPKTITIWPIAALTEPAQPSLAIAPEEHPGSYYLPGYESLRDRFLLEGRKFLEINFFEMKVRAYKNGALAKEVSILRKGDPQGWGGSPAGLYSVILKNKNGYSSIAEVFMPYSLKLYGKYYLHGEPFYPSGEKLISDFSGGCIQLSDENAKEIYELVNEAEAVLIVDKENDGFVYSEKSRSSFPEISAKGYLVADIDSGFIFAAKNENESLPIASLTKLMTAVVVAENVDLRRSIFVSEEMVNRGYGSTTGLEKGEEFRVVELFYPLLTESSNDAAEALGGFLGRERTINLMNSKAKKIMMENTSFSDLSGFGEKNVSTTKDFYYLLRYIYNNRPPILDITKGEKVNTYGGVRFKDLWNKNVFYEDPDFIGGKTGYIAASKYNGAFIFRFIDESGNERKVAIIILGAEAFRMGGSSLRADTQKIYGWLKENYF